ncbi:fumarylacetoacetate hydrolase family protein [Jiulongibacter sediminis]|uniref:Fumarylacetoacetase-like C-terminal domain-containing protein n=1 Tax=Jiulongibacter sediminis TaxID=1605367 RepID=A0A0P7BY60_9BACT|nr:fumarylacetoacetate hydrolase family protein [Jiulongibacter sediminis]KPM49763.1 hypothetical protein AFM12_04075 [Jiulongibacter sediminis]TBX26799.1 hypothetical protein TK44_04080 [Jiulongibacter sediminis]
MKLANIQVNGKATLAIQKDGYLIDTQKLGGPIFDSIKSYILASDDEKAQLKSLVEAVKPEEQGPFNYLPAVTSPEKIICVGLNYKTHILEMKRELPAYPVIFAKYPNVLAAHNETIPLPAVSDQMDYEAELAFVIGKRAKNVTREQAMDYVAGFTIANDLSVRDYQRRTIQFLQGKSFDKCGPMGPVMVTRDEFGSYENERMTLKLNGKTMQDTPLSDMVFPVEVLIEQISEIMTLEPGDVILSGTPGGVGAGFNPPIYLKDGDEVEIEVSNLGVLKNKFKKA